MSQVLEAIRRHASTAPDAIALSTEAATVTNRALLQSIGDTASKIAVACSGAAPVAICADNSLAWVIVDLAFVKLQRALVPLPAFFTQLQREHALEQTGCAFLITDVADSGRTPVATLAIKGVQLNVYQLEHAPVALPAGTAKVTYTSGTTGTPKGVCLSREGLENVSRSLVDAIGTDYAGVHMPVLPLAVLLENVAGLYTTILAGGEYRVLPQAAIGFGKSFIPDYAALVDALSLHRAASVIVVPEILRGILHVLAAKQKKLPDMKLVAVGGARVAPALLSAADALGLPVRQGYGLSEAGSVVALNTPAHDRQGSVGRILPHAALTVAADGELILRAQGFLGYVGDEAPPQTYATGDVGRLDDDGFLYIEGRKSNVLITAFARNVSPEWVESELLSQPQIGQAFVVGEAQPALGALIVPSSVKVTDAEIAAAIERANLALPEYARVRHWSKAFPFTPLNGQLTPNGRPRRAAINEAYKDVIAKSFAKPGQFVSFFERLVVETLAEREYLMATPQIRDGLAGRIPLWTYQQYLGEAYHHVKHTVPLLRRVRELLPPEKAWLAAAVDEYIEEESGHDEWILDDIRNSGGGADSVRHGMPRPQTEFMVSYAYDYINRINPAGFFGMVFVLEGTSTQLATQGAEALMRALHLPPNCFRYLTSHGTLDLSHMQFFQGLMNRIDDERDKEAIIHMAKRMFILFANVFRAIPYAAEAQHAA